MWNKYKSLFIILLLTYFISLPAGIISGQSVNNWYENIIRPNFSPPNWLFGPVWTFLYALMSYAAWNAWRLCNDEKTKKTILTIYFFHLLVSATWSFVFFGLQQIFFSIFIVFLIIIFIIILMKIYWNISKISMFLMMPYILWCCFALFLNFSIWRLN